MAVKPSKRKAISEESIQKGAQEYPLGRYKVFSLGVTTLKQLAKEGRIPQQDYGKLARKKPDGLIVQDSTVKAVIEYITNIKTDGDLTGKIGQEIEVAKRLCKLLIVTDGEKTYWINALNEEPILDEEIKQLRLAVNLSRFADKTITDEEKKKLEEIVFKIDSSISATNSMLRLPQSIDPYPLAKKVWQDVWVNTGKEPEKCLYNVVELFVFKFLSDLEVLLEDYSFEKVYEKTKRDPEDALQYYAQTVRPRIRDLFPASEIDKTTIINGTIFVNEEGKANLSQASLFKNILGYFQDFCLRNGSFKHIDKNFKTKLYESFLRQSAGIKALGQYFTPRKVVQAMVRMSNANSLFPTARFCDPFCGVGGFVLELINLNPMIEDQFLPQNGVISPQITLLGYDKGTDEKEDERTIILAKANMLIYFSRIIEKCHTCENVREFARIFNNTFHLLKDNLGTFALELEEENKFDLILTNPPYVTSGSKSLKVELESKGLASKYKAGGTGKEGLALEWIVRNLKPNGQALVVLPDGILNRSSDARLRKYVKEQCVIQGVISLPVRTFFATPKQTYILIITKKHNQYEQTIPVFTYLVSEIGESRDVNRFEDGVENHLIEAVDLFNQFKGAPESFRSSSKRCKIQPIQMFKDDDHWLVDRWWTAEEKEALEIREELYEISEEEFYELLKEVQDVIYILRRSQGERNE